MTGEVGFVCGVKKSLVQIEFSDDDDWYAVVSQVAHRAGLLRVRLFGFLNFSSSLRLLLTNLEAYGTGQTWQRTTSTKS